MRGPPRGPTDLFLLVSGRTPDIILRRGIHKEPRVCKSLFRP